MGLITMRLPRRRFIGAASLTSAGVLGGCGHKTGSASNQSFVSDPKLDALLEAQRREPDAAKRKDLVRQAVRLIVDQAYSIAIYRAASYQFWQPALKNYAPNFGNDAVPQPESWLER